MSSSEKRLGLARPVLPRKVKIKKEGIAEGLKSAMRLPLSLSSMLGSELGLSRLLPPSPLVELCTLNAL